MHIRDIAFICTLVFVSFFIGLNLGMHGMLPVDIKHIAQPSGSQQSAENVSEPREVQRETPGVPKSTEDIEKVQQNVPVVLVKSTPTIPPSPAKPKPTVHPLRLQDRLSTVNKLVLEHAADKYKGLSPSLHNKDYGASSIPIVLLTCNRPALLRGTLESLMKVRGVHKKNIIISQDGALKEVADIAHEWGITLIQNMDGLRLRGGAAADGASRIAKHYKYSLTSAFDRNKNANAVIIIEDDLLFAPDMYEYFHAVAPILSTDPSAFVVSAWNDNGFKEKVKDPYALRRTNYFPGLGWLLTRELYKGELEAKWPNTHWDHWLRSHSTSKGRDIIYPQVWNYWYIGILVYWNTTLYSVFIFYRSDVC
jgi:hypothetical protein